MALAINIIDGRDLSNEACHALLPKEEQGNSVFAVHFTVKAVYNQLYIANKMECLSFKGGRAVAGCGAY